MGLQRSAPYERLSLGDEARAYVERQILEGGLTLSRLVLERLRPGEGVLFTHLPPDLEPGQARDFDHGGVARLSSSEQALEQLLWERGSLLETGVFVAENAVASCADPIVRENPRGTFCYGEEVYSWVSCEASRRPDVRGALSRAASGWVLVAMLSSVPAHLGEPRLALRGCGRETLKALAERAELVVVGAYDGEGYVVWDGSPEPQ